MFDLILEKRVEGVEDGGCLVVVGLSSCYRRLRGNMRPIEARTLFMDNLRSFENCLLFFLNRGTIQMGQESSSEPE